MRPTFLILVLLGIGPWLVTGISSASEVNEADSNMLHVRQAGKSSVEFEVISTRPFPVTNAVAVLHVGGHLVALSRYPENGDLHTLIFSMAAAEFAKVKDGDPVTVQYDPESQTPWDFGRLDKSKVGK